MYKNTKIYDNNSKRTVSMIFFVLLVFILAIPLFSNLSLLASSDEEYIPYDYEITSYAVDINVEKSNVFEIKEDITVQMNEPMHGIIRAIPLIQKVTFEKEDKTVSMNYKTKISLLNVSTTYETYSEGGVFYIQIGNPYEIINGLQNYTIHYTISLGDDRNTAFDQIYYNVIGTYWDTSISDISFKITLPQDAMAEKMYIFKGKYGQTASEQISPDISGLVYEFSYDGTLEAYEGLTVRLLLEEGYFDNVRSYGWDIFLLLLMLVIIALAVFLFKKYHNSKITTPVVGFEVPDGLPPSEVGYIIDGIIDNKDISALIVYWAQKGYLNIINESKNQMTEVLYLEKVKEPDEALNDYEITLLKSLFKDEDKIKLENIGEKIGLNVLYAKNQILKKHESQNFNTKAIFIRGFLCFLSAILLAFINIKINTFAVRPAYLIGGLFLSFFYFLFANAFVSRKDKEFKKDKKIYIYLFIIIFALISILYSFVVFNDYSDPFFLTFISILLSLSLVFIAYKMNLRTNEGIELLGQIIGFRNFILLTEKDRIKMLVKEEPQIFYEVLPYAYVLDISDIWIEKFNNIIIPAPVWYQSQTNAVFDYLIFRSLFNNMMLISSLNMTRAKIDMNNRGMGGGFGGFGGGGGFSGGGFGGGGGRGW